MANKQKTIKAIAKRFKATKTGKVIILKGGKNHLNAKHSGKKIRQKRNDVIVSENSGKNLKQLLNK